MILGEFSKSKDKMLYIATVPGFIKHVTMENYKTTTAIVNYN